VFFSIKSTAQEAFVEIEQDEKINKLLEERKHLLSSGELVTHFTIQVISGSLETAKKTLKLCKVNFENYKSNIVYDEPNYKVRIGEFRNKLGADRSLLTIREQFPGSFVIKPQK
jgi:hypothetical protein